MLTLKLLKIATRVEICCLLKMFLNISDCAKRLYCEGVSKDKEAHSTKIFISKA